MGYFAWIEAILLGFALSNLDLGPKRDEALRMGQGGGWTDVQTYGHTYGRMDGQKDSPCVLEDFVPIGAAAQKVKIICLSIR